MVAEATRQDLRGLLIAKEVANDTIKVEDGAVIDPANTFVVGVFTKPAIEVEDRQPPIQLKSLWSRHFSSQLPRLRLGRPPIQVKPSQRNAAEAIDGPTKIEPREA